MEIGSLDLDTRFDYLLVYERDGKLHTWTLGKSGFRVNYPQMVKDKSVKILGVYKKMSDGEILNTVL